MPGMGSADLCHTSAVTLAGISIEAGSSRADHVASYPTVHLRAVGVGPPGDGGNFQVRRLRAVRGDCPPTADDQAGADEGLAHIRRQASDSDGAGGDGRRFQLQESEVKVLSVRVVARVSDGGRHIDVNLSITHYLFNFVD